VTTPLTLAVAIFGSSLSLNSMMQPLAIFSCAESVILNLSDESKL
jgi:hypothetical protein